jgi:hypothetical protein
MNGTSFSTRTGKIARLPRDIRQQLNHRLEDGESAQKLIAWLNETPAVQERLARYYEGRPITEQNLSDWKQGGFLDWQRHQESRAVLREFLSEAEELGEEAGEELLMDRMVNQVAVVLLRHFREAATAESGPEQQQALIELARELARLRRGDHQRQRVRLLAERQRVELANEEEDRQREEKLRRIPRLAYLGAQWESYLHELVNTKGDQWKMSVERFQMIYEFYQKHKEELIEAGFAPMDTSDGPDEPEMPDQGHPPGGAVGGAGKSPE